jgi:hypothetical protein
MAELNNHPKTEAPMRVVLTQRQVAQVLGRSPAWVVEQERDHGLPSLGDSGKERHYDAQAVITWHIQHELFRRGAEDPARRRWLEAKATAAEIDLARRLGQVMAVPEVRRGLKIIIGELAQTMLAAPARLAPALVDLDGHQLEQRLYDELNALLGVAANRLDALAASGERP